MAWSSYRLRRADITAVFADGCNAGVLLGEASRGLVDVDLDCPEAVRWAPVVLPATLAFGRASNRSRMSFRNKALVNASSTLARAPHCQAPSLQLRS